MSVACPSCKMQSPDGALYCDFCKEPFAKKSRPARVPQPAAAPDPLAGLSKEQALQLPAEELLKSDAPPPPSLPPWIRPLAYTFLAFCLAASAVTLWMLYSRYAERSGVSRPDGSSQSDSNASPAP